MYSCDAVVYLTLTDPLRIQPRGHKIDENTYNLPTAARRTCSSNSFAAMFLLYLSYYSLVHKMIMMTFV